MTQERFLQLVRKHLVRDDHTVLLLKVLHTGNENAPIAVEGHVIVESGNQAQLYFDTTRWQHISPSSCQYPDDLAFIGWVQLARKKGSAEAYLTELEWRLGPKPGRLGWPEDQPVRLIQADDPD